MTFNLMIAGVGGQGTVLASKLIAAAAMKNGCNVRTTETIGMSQRGGSVFGHVRIGENIFSPIIPLGKADAIIAFEPAEAVRQLPYLKNDGVVVACDSAVNPITGSYEASVMLNYLQTHAPRLIILDGRRLSGTPNAKTLNVALLGAAAQSRIFPFDADTLKEIMPDILPERFLEMNLNAFELGREICP
ncbi:MAG: indolepyruvate oxidoreductase subunit beta [Treponema sp.]|nr:indolepyruvate oxidoreductase subunit beta [Treponema sp.]